MIDYEISEMREFAKLMAPSANFDVAYTFYYDETNNIGKFYVREDDFNTGFAANFILGGLVHAGEAPDVQGLISSFQLQKNAKEVKFKHVASGSFLDCLKSEKLNLFLRFILQSNLYVHYSNLNILYWSIVDIVDSAIANSKIAQQLGPAFSERLKNDLYDLSRMKIDSVRELFYRFQYPNVKSESLLEFIESLTSLFDDYIETERYHFGLESLRQILNEAKKSGSLPFIMDEEDYIILKDLSHFYLKPVYLFKNSTHILDNEASIVSTFGEYRILDGDDEITNYTFVDSQTNQLVQLSDVFVGITGKLTQYLNTTTREKIEEDFASLTPRQQANIDLLLDLMTKSHEENIGFLHNVVSYDESAKMNRIYQLRGKHN